MQGLGDGERWKINLSLTRKTSQGNNELPSLTENREGELPDEAEAPQPPRLGSSWTVPDDRQTARPLEAQESGRVSVPFKIQNLIKPRPILLMEGSRALARTSQEMADNSYVLVLTWSEPHPHTCTHERGPSLKDGEDGHERCTVSEWKSW